MCVEGTGDHDDEPTVHAQQCGGGNGKEMEVGTQLSCEGAGGVRWRQFWIWWLWCWREREWKVTSPILVMHESIDDLASEGADAGVVVFAIVDQLRDAEKDEWFGGVVADGVSSRAISVGSVDSLRRQDLL